MSQVGDLPRAQAYRVDTHDGRIGSVAAVLPRAGGEPGYLLVHTGLMSCQLTSVPFAAVEDVDPERRRVLLQESPAVEEAGHHGSCDPIVVRT
jgi:hypothetical protein